MTQHRPKPAGARKAFAALVAAAIAIGAWSAGTSAPDSSQTPYSSAAQSQPTAQQQTQTQQQPAPAEAPDQSAGGQQTRGQSSSAQALPDSDWASWSEDAAPQYFAVTGAAQVRHSVSEGDAECGSLDSLGRTTWSAANITYNMRQSAKQRGRLDISDIRPSGWPRRNPECTIRTPDGSDYHGRFWNRSHLVADSLGGDAVRENLVTGTRMQNAASNDGQGGMEYGEAIARDWIDAHPGGTLYYAAEPLYLGDELIPRAVVVDMLSSDGAVDMEILVYNAAAGYSIDYYDGEISEQ